MISSIEALEIENQVRERMSSPLAPPMAINHNENQYEVNDSNG